MEDSVQNSDILDKNFNVEENLESSVQASEAEVTEGCTGMETFEGLISKIWKIVEKIFLYDKFLFLVFFFIFWNEP